MKDGLDKSMMRHPANDRQGVLTRAEDIIARKDQQIQNQVKSITRIVERLYAIHRYVWTHNGVKDGTVSEAFVKGLNEILDGNTDDVTMMVRTPDGHEWKITTIEDDKGTMTMWVNVE